MQLVILKCALVALGILAIAATAMVLWQSRRTWSAGLVALAVSCTILAQKQPSATDRVEFPLTDPEARYLIDAGSYVTNTLVHLAFTTLIVPPTATIHLDYRPKADTNATYSTAFALPLSSLTLPLDYPCPNATNYHWCCYTDWTPGPSAVTNDTYIINWMLPQPDPSPSTLIPLRTQIETAP